MIEHEIEGHTAFLTIDNPPANTWTPESLRALEKLVAELNANRDVYAAVITGAGAKFFSAGADLKSFQGDKVRARHFIACFGAAFEALMNSRFVTIAAINGYAMGGGLECSPRRATSASPRSTRRWRCPSPRWACCPSGCGTQNLPWLVGEGWAKRIILTNERVDAPTALRIGLVQEVVEKGQGLAKATEIAERVATLCARAPSSTARSSSTTRATASRAARASPSSASASWTSSTTPTRPKASTPSSRSASPNGRTTERGSGRASSSPTSATGWPPSR